MGCHAQGVQREMDWERGEVFCMPAEELGAQLLSTFRPLFTFPIDPPLLSPQINFKLIIPPEYPSVAPGVEMTRESGLLLQGHPNVFPGAGPHGTTYICLDMLKPNVARWRGWSAAYTLRVVLEQLGGFLLEDETIEQEYGISVTRRDDDGAGQQRPQPMLSDWLEPLLPLPVPAPSSSIPFPSINQPAEIDPSSDKLDILGLLDDNLCYTILGNLDHVALNRCIVAGTGTEGARLARIAVDVQQRSQLRCFYTKQTFQECVLGLGIKTSFANKGPRQILRQALARPDLLSLEAFRNLKVRADASNFAIDAFLPIYLNPEHGSRSLHEIIPCMDRILPTDDHESNGSRLLHLLASITNSIVVEMAGGKERGEEEEQVSRSMSDAALQTYCYLHHTLLAIVTGGSSGKQQREMGRLAGEVLTAARSSVQRFIRGPASERTKERFPDLGLLLVAYTLTPADEAPWCLFGPALLRELLARQVFWVAKESEARFLDVTADEWGSEARLRQHFQHSKVGLRLVMIQAFFANSLARPSKAATLMEELLGIKRGYDSLSGLPPPSTFQSFNTAVRSSLTAGSWSAFLRNLRLGFRPGDDQRALFASALKQAVLDSSNAGYHRGPRPVPPPLQGARTREQVMEERAFFHWSKFPIGEAGRTWRE